MVISGDPALGVGSGAPLHRTDRAHGLMDRQNPNAGSTNIELDNANYVTLEHLTLTGAQTGLWVHNQSTHFAGSDLTVTDNAGDGILIESDSTATAVDRLTAYDNGGNGMTMATPIASLSNSTAYDNGGIGIT